MPHRRKQSEEERGKLVAMLAKLKPKESTILIRGIPKDYGANIEEYTACVYMGKWNDSRYYGAIYCGKADTHRGNENLPVNFVFLETSVIVDTTDKISVVNNRESHVINILVQPISTRYKEFKELLNKRKGKQA